MSKKLDLNEFFKLYNNSLLPKEDILKQLNITEYFYKKIIKEYQLKRKRTSEFNRIKIENEDFIIPNMIENTNSKQKPINKPKKEEVEVVFIGEDIKKEKKPLKENITIDNNATNLLKDALKATDKTLDKVRNKKIK